MLFWPKFPAIQQRMYRLYFARRSLAVVTGFALAVAVSTGTLAQEVDRQTLADIVAPPACSNDKGETVRFIERGAEGGEFAAGMAARSPDGGPVVFRSNYATAPPEFQSFVDRHECAHHQTGDVDRPHPPRNGPEHLMNESISDCIAVLRLRDEEGYDAPALGHVTAALREDMTALGFPAISIDSRLANIAGCFTRPGTARDLIDKVLKKRGLDGR